jgi:hypothetical protein
MKPEYKFLEFDDDSAINNAPSIGDGYSHSDEFVLGAEWQHAKDRMIMEKLLEANRVMKRALIEIDNTTDCKFALEIVDKAIAKKDEIMKGLE